MKPTSTISSVLLAALATGALASSATAAPAATTAAVTTSVAESAFVPAKNDKPYALLYGKGGKPQARWYPCKPITWAIVAKGLVPEEIPRVTEAFAIISSATGLTFKYKGVSKKHGKTPRYNTPTIPGADIAVKFENFQRTLPKKAGASGYGGAQYPGYTSQIGRLQNGYMQIDSPDLPAIPEAVRTLLYLHELGHVMGLDHKAGPNIMNATIAGDITQFSAGDLAGLKLVGRHAKDCKASSPFRS